MPTDMWNNNYFLIKAFITSDDNIFYFWKKKIKSQESSKSHFDKKKPGIQIIYSY